MTAFRAPVAETLFILDEVLGIGRSKVYELLRAGVIQSVRIGACRRIPAAAVAEHVERARHGTA